MSIRAPVNSPLTSRFTSQQVLRHFQFICDHKYLLYVISLAEANVDKCTYTYIFDIYHACTINNRLQKYISNLDYLNSISIILER